MSAALDKLAAAGDLHGFGAEPGLDYRRMLGARAWQALPQATRERFSTHTAHFEGRMHLRASPIGWLFAWLASLFGSLLPKVRAARVVTVVDVSPDAATGGSRWARSYRLGNTYSRVETVKALDDDGQLVERLPGGLRMHLKLFVREGALHFKSTHYSIDWAGLRLRLPAWWPPGCTEVIHRDLGFGQFRFTMYIRHPLLGELFCHDGVFAPQGANA